MDFLAPSSHFIIQWNGSDVKPDANAIFHNVTDGGLIMMMLRCGCVPLTPKGFVDPR